MFWDDKDDSESWQFFKNMSFLNMPLNNKDRDEVLNSKGFWITLVVVVGILLLIVLL